MLNDMQLEHRLALKSAQDISIFSARATIRMLPLLDHYSYALDYFGIYSDNKGTRHLLSIFRALNIGFFVPHIKPNQSFYSSFNSISQAASEVGYQLKSSSSNNFLFEDDASYRIVADIAYAAAYAAKSSAYAIKPTQSYDDFDDAVEFAIKGVEISRKLFAECDVPEANKSLDADIESDNLYKPIWLDNQMPEKLKDYWEKDFYSLDSKREGFSIWFEWYESRMRGESIAPSTANNILNISEAVYAQGPSAYNNALYKIISEAEDIQPVNQVRAIFIGNGEAGKTSLIRRLHNEAVVEGKEKMTPGIEIRSWPVSDTDLQAKLWDFGGQVVGHSTHQFFLREDCVYILVLNGRSELNANDQAEYWLEHVKAFGKNAPVMLVGNKHDLMPVNLDMGALKEKYPNITGFYPLSCVDRRKKYARLFETFKLDLIDQFLELNIHQVLFSKNEFLLLESLRELSASQSLIKHEDYVSLCKEFDVGGQNGLSQHDLLGLLDKLGEIVHFSGLSHLGKYVLNPRWLTYGVYTLLYSEEINQTPQGELTDSQVVAILTAAAVTDEHGQSLEFSREHCSFVIESMQEFKLCYRLESDRHRIIFPDKLPPNQPDLPMFEHSYSHCLSFEFQFRGFLPRHVMPMLIVSRHGNIKDKLVWQNGAIFSFSDLKVIARVQVDYYDRMLTIRVMPDTRSGLRKSGVKEVLEIFRDEVKSILNRMTAIEYEEKVLLPKDAAFEEDMNVFMLDEKASYQQLIATAEMGRTEFISNSGCRYDLKKVLGEILTDEKREKMAMNIQQHFHGHVGAVSAGDHNHVKGSVNIHQALTAAELTKLDEIVNTLSEQLLSTKGEMSEKVGAIAELGQAQQLLSKRENLTDAETDNVKDFYEKLKSGTLKIFQFSKVIKDNGENISWMANTIQKLWEVIPDVPII